MQDVSWDWTVCTRMGAISFLRWLIMVWRKRGLDMCLILTENVACAVFARNICLWMKSSLNSHTSITSLSPLICDLVISSLTKSTNNSSASSFGKSLKSSLAASSRRWILWFARDGCSFRCLNRWLNIPDIISLGFTHFVVTNIALGGGFIQLANEA